MGSGIVILGVALLLQRLVLPVLGASNSDYGLAHVLVANNRLLELIQQSTQESFVESINIKDAQGNTPLMQATAMNAPSIVAVLMAASAKVDMENNDRLTALQLACQSGYRPIVEALMCFSPSNLQNPDSRHLYLFAGLKAASKSCNSDLVQLIISKCSKADRNLTTQMLICLCQSKDETDHQLFSTLLANNANVNGITSMLQTPLCGAITVGNLKIFKQLINAKASVGLNCSNFLAPTPLMYALKRENSGHHHQLEMIHCLLKAQADPNQQTITGETPLHVACKGGNLEIVSTLIHSNALVDSSYRLNTASGETVRITPICEAICSTNLNLVQAMIDTWKARLDGIEFVGINDLGIVSDEVFRFLFSKIFTLPALAQLKGSFLQCIKTQLVENDCLQPNYISTLYKLIQPKQLKELSPPSQSQLLIYSLKQVIGTCKFSASIHHSNQSLVAYILVKYAKIHDISVSAKMVASNSGRCIEYSLASSKSHEPRFIQWQRLILAIKCYLLNLSNAVGPNCKVTASLATAFKQLFQDCDVIKLTRSINEIDEFCKLRRDPYQTNLHFDTTTNRSPPTSQSIEKCAKQRINRFYNLLVTFYPWMVRKLIKGGIVELALGLTREAGQRQTD